MERNKNKSLEIAYILLYTAFTLGLALFMILNYTYGREFPTTLFYYSYGFIMFIFFLVPKILPNSGAILKALRIICSAFFTIVMFFKFVIH